MKSVQKYTSIVLITDSYPFRCETEGAFVAPELAFLSNAFKRVVIVPVNPKVSSSDIAGDLPENVEVARWWINHPDCNNAVRRMRYLLSPYAWRMLRGDFSRLSCTFVMACMAFAAALPQWMRKSGLDWGSTLFYTFWFDMGACALGMLSDKYPVRFISRAHGYDIQSERGLRLRSDAVRMAAGLYPASETGSDVFRMRFPDMSNKVRTSILGCDKSFPDVMAANHQKSDMKLTFLSVARMAPEKRVGMIFDFMRALAVARRDVSIEWLHVGEGPERPDIELKIASRPVENLNVTLLGRLDNMDVQRIYAERPVDWSILLSSSEGGHPIAACESLAYGVPVVATQVGGLGEMIDDDCGLLLSANPTEEEFVRGIIPYLDSEYRTERLRQGAYEKWRDSYDASVLRASFADEISKL